MCFKEKESAIWKTILIFILCMLLILSFCLSFCIILYWKINSNLREVAWAKFIEIVLNRSITQPLASSREFSWRCSLSTLVVDSHRCCWLITFSSRPRVRNCLHFINLLNCQEDPNKPKLWVALWINCTVTLYFGEAGGYICNTTCFILRYWNRR